MRKIIYSLLIILLLSACSQEENTDMTENDVISLENIEIPDTIFISEENNHVIDKEEMKQSIKTYLDISEELENASYPFEELIDDDQELNEIELEKFNKINSLIKENDDNFSNYILHNTLPEGYQEESERISQYITASHQYLYKLDEALNDLTDNISEGNFSDIDMESIIDESGTVNGREQKKIEEFLNQENIHTKAFGG
ncbi:MULTISPECIES: NDxxF motif lipoprotein [Oceanobacillus]